MERAAAFIGFGEAGETFARDERMHGSLLAFDVDPKRSAAMGAAGVDACGSFAAALSGVGQALCVVTADQALAAAEAAAHAELDGLLWYDMNSVSPDTKRAAAEVIELAGGRYVDVAIMAPVAGTGLGVPLLVSGPHGEAAATALADLGFTTIRHVGDRIGQASSVKMLRSVMVKGVEALTDEMMAGAYAAGVVEEVLASLDGDQLPRPWRERATYNLERMHKHGLRRAAEMEEVARTLAALGVDPVMTEGTVRRQRDAGTGGAQERSAA